MKTKSILALVAVFIMAFVAFTLIISPPALYSPTDGATGVERHPATLQWNPVSESGCTITYELQINTNSNFNGKEMIANPTSLTTTSFQINLNSGTYYWRVRATSSGGESCSGTSEWSDVWYFTTEN